jgi:hypothetical protein
LAMFYFQSPGTLILCSSTSYILLWKWSVSLFNLCKCLEE